MKYNTKGNGAIATVGNLYNGHTAEPTDFETSLMESSTVTGLSPNQARGFVEFLAQTQIEIVANSEGLTIDRATLQLYLEFLDSQK